MRRMERLNRGLIAARAENGMYLSWRYLGDEPDGITWRVYRRRNEGPWEQLTEILGKKVGFLKGLMEGMDFEAHAANGKLMAGIVDLLGDLSDRVEAIDELLEDLNDYVESIDEDLTELEGEREDDLFDDDEDDDADFDDMLFDDGEDKLHLLKPAQSEKTGEEALAGNLCPRCDRMFFTALGDDEGAEYLCPHCGERVKPLPLTPENAPIAKPIEGD